MKFIRPALLAAAAAALCAGPLLAQGPADMAIKARKGLMDNLAFNLGTLGGMAKGAIPYDAKMAQTAADNLAALASVDQAAYWPEGSDDMSADNTRALPAVWDKHDEFLKHIVALNEAAGKMKAAAGTDLASLQGAMGTVGGACGGCHKTFRAPDN
ncbi:c-type cytochrome [Acidimangrovimonas pyrenivorans]|uniref:C-type cytochrome n=1 Tax=Acidimangrovimonas pyrenivorans TaxID=2030798 RepID=A0ABV7AES9_9RHOB